MLVFRGILDIFDFCTAQTPADARVAPIISAVPEFMDQAVPASPKRNRLEATPNQLRQIAAANGPLRPVHQHKACNIACTAQTLTAHHAA
jgi:hypothetical protein